MRIGKRLKAQITEQTKEVIKDCNRDIKHLKTSLKQARLNKATAEAILRGL